MEIVYLEPPVSTEKKRELNAAGFRVVDARFKPADLEQDKQDAAPPIKRHGLRSKRGERP